jgi:uncharacterized protein YqhQ
VLEGVMMRSPHAFGISVRKASGEMVSHSEPLERPSEKHKWLGWPVIRGLVTLGQAMALGFRALRYSANVALEEAQAGEEEGKKLEMNGWVATVNIVISLGFFIGMYKALPWLATMQLRKIAPSFNNQVLLSLVDGAIRLVIFLIFIWLTSLWKDLRRVYEYHGAEHKTVFAFESGEPLSIKAAQKFSTFHPRCGTSFLMTVMLISIAVYALSPFKTFWAGFAMRLLLLPVIAGVSYEIIRFAARLRSSKNSVFGSWIFTMLTAPGLWLQRITTQPPADDQVECAITALNEAMDLEKMRGGELVIA